MQEKLSVYENIIDIIFIETIKYTQELITDVNKSNSLIHLYFALDGVPSMAKMKEQKNRRYIGSYINQIKQKIVKEHIFGTDNIFRIDLFYYRSMICAGTKFMEKIESALYNLDTRPSGNSNQIEPSGNSNQIEPSGNSNQIEPSGNSNQIEPSGNSNQVNIKVDISPVTIKGEGEKKIINEISKLSESYNSICIMSPDSDMIILSSLLIHNDKFLGKKIYNFRIDYQNNNTYQFIDMFVLLENMKIYYSNRISVDINTTYLLDAMFMLFVFGNDFLPKLEPFDITTDFDFVIDTCLILSSNGTKFMLNNGKLNYEYILDFFKIMENNSLDMAITSYLNSTYQNYSKLIIQLELTNANLESNYHHSYLHPIYIDHTNIIYNLNMVSTSFHKMINFIKDICVNEADMENLYYDIHGHPADSYMLLTIPALVKFPGSEICGSNSFVFFSNLVAYIQKTKSVNKIKFLGTLRIRKFDTVPKTKCSSNTDLDLNPESEAYDQINRLDMSLEPYRTMFGIKPINLVKYDIYKNKFMDLRRNYYKDYCQIVETKGKINMVENYLVGVEWLYQYYIQGVNLEYGGWSYDTVHAPLVSDIIFWLKKNIKKQYIL
jgi:5'-3' exonuclease